MKIAVLSYGYSFVEWSHRGFTFMDGKVFGQNCNFVCVIVR